MSAFSHTDWTVVCNGLDVQEGEFRCPAQGRTDVVGGTIVPDIPASSLAAAESAIRDELGVYCEVPPSVLARAALEAAAPILAEEIAQKLLDHVMHPDSCDFCARLGEGAAAAVVVQRIDRP